MTWMSSTRLAAPAPSEDGKYLDLYGVCQTCPATFSVYNSSDGYKGGAGNGSAPVEGTLVLNGNDDEYVHEQDMLGWINGQDLYRNRIQVD